MVAEGLENFSFPLECTGFAGCKPCLLLSALPALQLHDFGA